MAVTLEQAKAWLRVEHDAEDALIGRMIAAASAEVESYAPSAPDAVKERAIETMLAERYDNRAEGGDGLRLVKPMLTRWRARRARKIKD